jgi:hypothetical protein
LTAIAHERHLRVEVHFHGVILMRERSRPLHPALLVGILVLLPLLLYQPQKITEGAVLMVKWCAFILGDRDALERPPPAYPNERFEDIISFARDPIQREIEIRDTLERKMLSEELTDWRAIDPYFKDGHLSRLRVIRDGDPSNKRVLIILPTDQSDRYRLFTLQAIEATPFCESQWLPLRDHEKKTKAYMLTYKCKLFLSA